MPGPALIVLLVGFFGSCSALAGDVRIEGLEGDMLKNAQHYVDLYQRRDDEKLSPRWRENLHKEAPEQIRQSLQPFGYYNAVVEEATLSGEGDAWLARYQVRLGKPVRVGETDIQWQGEGAARPELLKAINRFPLKKGDALVHKAYEDGKSLLQDAAYELGYVKVKPVESVVRVNPQTNLASIRMILDTGPLYHFGEITLYQDFLDPALLQHYVNLKEDGPYSNQELIEFQQRLISADWFSVVEVKPDFEAAQDAAVPIDVYLTPAQRHKLEFGLGYATDVGVRGSARWNNKRVNRYGHQAGVSLQLAQVKGTLSANYQMPVRNPRTDRLAFTSAYEYEYLDSSDRDTFNLEAAFLRTTLDRKNSFKLFSEYRYENFSSGSQSDNTTSLLSLGGIVRRTVSEEAEFIRRGYNVSADLRVAPSFFLSDTAVLRAEFNGSYLHPIGSRGRLNLRGDIGLAWVEDFDKYPNSLRFFAGGDQSVRGYGYKDLGPVDADGLTIGGKNLLVGSLEYDHRIMGKWVGAVFVDAGNAFNDRFDELFVGAGGGVRWLAPFGSLRLDIAWPVSENPTAGDFRIHLGLGAVL